MNANQVYFHILAASAVLDALGNKTYVIVAMAPTLELAFDAVSHLKITDYAIVICTVITVSTPPEPMPIGGIISAGISRKDN